jgi:NAD(P)-dependent dehydrogenase (short-subunit alcohol dehydrogenase family)
MRLTGLEDKIAIVTGASRGIGSAIARSLVKSGTQVVVCARTMELLEDLCHELEREGGRAIPVKADIAKPSDRKRVVDSAIEMFGGIDFLINNAGVHFEKPAIEMTDEDLQEVMNINFFSMFSMARDSAKIMIKRGGGKIVNMGSFWGQLGVPKHLAYCVSKAAIEAMTRCLAVEWARYNIQVNTVAPGHIMTDLSKAALEDERLSKEILRRIPARRIGEPEEVAHLVTFLCSQQSNYITGHIYCIDGGQQISW